MSLFRKKQIFEFPHTYSLLADMYRNLHVSKIESFSNGSFDVKTSTFYYCLETFFKYMFLNQIFPCGLYLGMILETSKHSECQTPVTVLCLNSYEDKDD